MGWQTPYTKRLARGTGNWFGGDHYKIMFEGTTVAIVRGAQDADQTVALLTGAYNLGYHAHKH